MNAAVRSYARSHGISPEAAEKALFGDKHLDTYYALEQQFDNAQTPEDMEKLEAALQVHWVGIPESDRREVLTLAEMRQK